MTRRNFLISSSAVATAKTLTAVSPRYRVGITSNTEGGWEKDVFLGFREAREVGYRYVEAFLFQLVKYYDRPQDLKAKLDEIGVNFVTISNSGPTEMHFEDPSRHERIYADYLRLARFVKYFGCTHLKINMGPRRPTGTTDEDLRNMARALDELGRRISEEVGIKFATHAHPWSQFENGREIDFILGNTDPKHVWFVLDTGNVAICGVDPLKLTRQLGHRIVEFHLNDTKPNDSRFGPDSPPSRAECWKNPCHFPLGEGGGVDLVGIKAHLDKIGWRGWFTVELYKSFGRPPKECARISREYIEKVLKVRV